MELEGEARAELAALRARAYGPDADIAADPPALARLRELEILARPAPNPSGILAGDPTADAPPPSGGPDVEPPRSPADPGEPVPTGARSRRGAWLAAAGAGLALVVAVVVTDSVRGPEAVPPSTADSAESDRDADAPPFAFTVPAGADLLIRVPIDGSFGSYRELPASDVPVLPQLGEVRWSEPLGEYYGYDLWIGAVLTGDGEELCVVAAAEALQDTDCGSRRDWEGGALVASVPYISIEADELPDALAPGESLRFWWTPDDTVYVLSGTAAVAAGG